jgi:outer membrane protein assembly factor BamD (BamD/ComL family)
MELEVRLLDEARSALSARRGSDALDALDRYGRQAQGRRLAPEAAYLEMEAYVLLGDRAAAQRSARDLLARYPGGPHVARARRVLSSP